MSTTTTTNTTLNLANNYTPEVDLYATNGFTIFGEKGSGKTGVAARILEQIAQHYIPMVVFDKEGDLLSLKTHFPRAYVATQENLPPAQDILEYGLQVVVDLSSWSTSEDAALMMSQLIYDLMTHARSQKPGNRVPCLITLDEGQYWLPQRTNDSDLEHTAQVLMKKAWQAALKRGRKLGIIPCVITQNISQISKTCLSGGIYILMRQTLDSDLNRYTQYIRSHNKRRVMETIRAYPLGKAIIISPEGQLQCTFHQRESVHISQTPTTLSAVTKFKSMKKYQSKDAVA